MKIKITIAQLAHKLDLSVWAVRGRIRRRGIVPEQIIVKGHVLQLLTPEQVECVEQAKKREAGK